MLDRCYTYVISNYKGGVGKTTTTAVLGVMLAQLMREQDPQAQVLLIDTDPQGHLLPALGLEQSGERCLSQVLLGDGSLSVLQENVRPGGHSGAPRPGLFVLPSTVALKDAVDDILADAAIGTFRAVRKGRSVGSTPIVSRMEEKLGVAKQYFDIILIDSQPALGSLQPAIHQFADEAIVPFRAAYLDSLGTNQHTQSIREDQEAGIEISIFCLLPTFSRPRLRLTRAMMKNVREAYGASPIAHPIPSTVRIEEAPSKGLTIAEYDKDAKAVEAAEAYWKLARNALTNAKKKAGYSKEAIAA